MQQSEITWLIKILTSYISFGLALYAAGGVLALLWIRRRQSAGPRFVLADLARSYAVVVFFVLFEAVRQVWDSFNADHFPLWVTRIVLPVAYLTLGNSVIRMAGSERSDSRSQQ